MRDAPLLLTCMLFAVVARAVGAPPAPYHLDPGPYSFSMADESWRDDVRKKDMPVRVWTPKGIEGERFPVVIFSHGAGGSNKIYTYFVRHMASYGYLVIQPQHAEALAPSLFGPAAGAEGGPSLLDRAKAKLRELKDGKPPDANSPGGEPLPPASHTLAESLERTNEPADLIHRPRDISFVIDHLGADARLAALADMGRIGVAGHSFGAYTALAAAGMVTTPPNRTRMTHRDNRLRAALAFCPQGSGVMGVAKDAWDGISIPVMLQSGTGDMGADAGAAWRHEPMDHLNNADAYFVNITDAHHFSWSMSGPRGNDEGALAMLAKLPGKYNARHTDWILQCSAAFLDAYLRDDAAALAWLRNGDIGPVSGGQVAIEARPKPQPPSQPLK